MLTLFVLADLLCATCCVPIVMGLSERVHPLAALAGCLAGLITALAVYGAGPAGFPLLTTPGALYAETSLHAFIFTPIASGVATILVALPFAFTGYKFEGYGTKPPAEADGSITVTVGDTAQAQA